MADRRRRRRRSDVSSGEEEEDNVWSGSEATASEESGNESDQTDEELSRLNETPATDKEDNGVPTPEVQSDAEKEGIENTTDEVKAKSDSVEEVNGKEEQEEKQEEKQEEEKQEEQEIEEEEEDNEDEENEDEEKEKSDEESPTHVPRRGMFYQHDDRNYVEPGEDGAKRSRGSRVDNTGRVWGGKKEPKWSRDLFKEEDQRPKEDWEKMRERQRRKMREGPPKQHRESEFKHHVPTESRGGPPSNPYIQREVSEEETMRDTRRRSREGIGRGKHRSSEDQQTVGEVDIGKESYRRPDFNAEPGQPNQTPRNREETSGEKSQPERRKSDQRVRSSEHEKPERDDSGRSRGGRRREYNPQQFDRHDVVESYNGKPSENTVDREPVSERGRGKRRGNTRNNTDKEPEYEYKQRGRDTNKDYDQKSRDTNVDYERDRDRQSGVRRRGGNKDRRPRYRDYDSDEEERYEDTRRTPRRGREHDDEIWKQLEQLKIDQLKLGLQVAQSRYRDEGNLVGKGRSRHTRTSPNQNSLIYKIAQEKAQEMAANQSNSSPTESDQDERVAAVAYEDSEPQHISDMSHIDYPPAPHPKFTSSTVQTEGEIVTVKPKRYSQRSKNVDPNALREKVRETMSMEDYSGHYHGSSGGGGGGYHQDPNYPPSFNPYAQEFPFSEQDRHYDQQMQQMVMLQQMSRNYSHPPPQHGNTDYIQQAILHQQQLQQQQAAMMATYMQAPSQQLHPDQDMINDLHMKRSNKAIPIVDPTTQIHMTPVVHEN